MDPLTLAEIIGGISVNLYSDLIESYLKLRKTRKAEELESEEWKLLEKSYFEHLKWRFDYPKKVFGQQTFSGWLITILVVVLILSGLAFSFMQLHSAISLGDFSNLKSDVNIETAGKLSINSSIVGAIVLVISLVFFYLYLNNVFKIQYPTPPHVGFKETDIIELLRNRTEKSEISMNELVKALQIKSAEDKKHSKRKSESDSSEKNK